MRGDGALLRGEGNLIQIPFIVFNDGIQVEREVGDQQMRFEAHSAGRRDEDAIGPHLNENF